MGCSHHRRTADLAGIDGSKIKREEKYFVFIRMSRKERMITEKMDRRQYLRM
jgi:hypothetical protein